jgi:hypothetical protein
MEHKILFSRWFDIILVTIVVHNCLHKPLLIDNLSHRTVHETVWCCLAETGLRICIRRLQNNLRESWSEDKDRNQPKVGDIFIRGFRCKSPLCVGGGSKWFPCGGGAVVCMKNYFKQNMDKQFQNPLLSFGSLLVIQKYRIQSHKASAF